MEKSIKSQCHLLGKYITILLTHESDNATEKDDIENSYAAPLTEKIEENGYESDASTVILNPEDNDKDIEESRGKYFAKRVHIF